MDPLSSFTSFLSSPIFNIFIIMAKLFVIVFWFALVGWTYRDANRRGTSSAYWAVVVFLFNVFGFLIYLMLRPPEFIDEARERELEIKTLQAQLRGNLLSCPACHKSVGNDYLICPHCRKKLKSQCSKCDKPLNLSWTICPYCKTST